MDEEQRPEDTPDDAGAGASATDPEAEASAPLTASAEEGPKGTPPTVDETDATGRTAAAAPVAAPVAAAPPPPVKHDRYVVHVPRWLAWGLAVVLVAGGFFALGHFTAGGDDDHDQAAGSFFDQLPRGRLQQPQPQQPQQPQQPRGNVAPTNGPVLGVAVVDVNSSEARQLGVTADKGAVVVRVATGSGADKAGIKVGDVITRIGSETIDNAADAAPAVQHHNAGDTVDVVVLRNGNSQTLRVTLENSAGATTS